jgi:poly-gamma-glutamate synthesis protein (capsule biosynthesis protein)
MKKVLVLLSALIVPLLFFSFLVSTTGPRKGEITLFFDTDLSHEESRLMTRTLSEILGRMGYRTKIDRFEAQHVNSYLLTNPDALYVSEKEMSSDLFVLQRIDYLDFRVPISARTNSVKDIDSSMFDELLPGVNDTDADIVKKVARNRIKVGVVSFDELTLAVQPLSVDGIFPTRRAIKNDSYPWAMHAYIYGRDDNEILEQDGLREKMGVRMEEVFTLIAGGDIMLSRGISKYLDLFGSRYPFLGIRNEIIGHDIAFANLETPISSRGTRFYPNKGIYFRADPSVIDGLLFAGFDIFSLGNNHCLDWGSTALQDTMDILKYNGFEFSGAGTTWHDAFYPAVLDINGTRVAIISINDIYPFEVRESDGRSMFTLTYDAKKLLHEIKTLEQKYDIIIASVHAGIEYISKPELSKVDMMRNLIDCGIDVVLGSHPHVIQGIEVYGDGLIAYSLGNLIFDQSWSRSTSLGLLLEICFLRDRPLYYHPRIVYIHEAQACLLDDEESRSIISTLTMENGAHEYVKN